MLNLKSKKDLVALNIFNTYYGVLRKWIIKLKDKWKLIKWHKFNGKFNWWFNHKPKLNVLKKDKNERVVLGICASLVVHPKIVRTPTKNDGVASGGGHSNRILW